MHNLAMSSWCNPHQSSSAKPRLSHPAQSKATTSPYQASPRKPLQVKPIHVLICHDLQYQTIHYNAYRVRHCNAMSGHTKLINHSSDWSCPGLYSNSFLTNLYKAQQTQYNQYIAKQYMLMQQSVLCSKCKSMPCPFQTKPSQTNHIKSKQFQVLASLASSTFA